MMNGIIVALPQELRTLTRKKLKAGVCYALNERWMVILSGIGAEAAGSAARCLLEREAGLLVSWGAAAALDPRLESGALLLPAIVMDAAGRRYDCDPFPGELLGKKLPKGYFISKAPLFGAAPLLESPARKAALYESSGSVAADMESAAIAAVALEAGRPFAVVRAVFDDAGTILPSAVLQALDAGGKIKLGRLIAGLVASPAAILPLIKLGMGYRRAAKSLTAAAGVLLQEF